MNIVISITQREKEIISAKYPRVHIVRTMKSRSKRHRYYMAEEVAAMKVLRSLRCKERECDL
jgi:hypothetical protein